MYICSQPFFAVDRHAVARFIALEATSKIYCSTNVVTCNLLKESLQNDTFFALGFNRLRTKDSSDSLVKDILETLLS